MWPYEQQEHDRREAERRCQEDERRRRSDWEEEQQRRKKEADKNAYDEDERRRREEEQRLSRLRNEEEERQRQAWAAANRTPSRPMTTEEQFFVFGLGLLIIVAALFFVIGYASAADIRNGVASQSWALNSVVRTLPVLVVLATLHLTVLRQLFGAIAFTWYAPFLVAMVAIAGPERAAVLGYFTIIPFAVMKIGDDRGEAETDAKLLVFVGLNIPWLVFIGGAVFGFFDRFPSWNGSGVLQLPFSVALVPIDNAGELTPFVMFILTAAPLFLVEVMNEVGIFIGLVIALVIAFLLFWAGLFAQTKLGISDTAIACLITGWLRVSIMTTITTAFLFKPGQLNWTSLWKGKIPPVITQNPIAVFGLLAMVALEIVFGFAVLSRS